MNLLLQVGSIIAFVAIWVIMTFNYKSICKYNKK